MKTNRQLLILGAIFLLLGTRASAQQADNGWRKQFKRAWIYNWTNSTWVLQDRITPSYDKNGVATGAIAEALFGGNWIVGERIHAINNSNGVQIAEVDSQFNGSAFLPSELDSFWYNSDGTITTRIVYKPNNGGWIPWNRHSFKYANGNKLISEDFQEEWLSATSSWGNDDDYFYSYNSSNAIIQILDKNWQANTWVVDHRDTINFNSQGQVNEVVHQDTGANNKTWVNVNKTVFDTATNSGIAIFDNQSINVSVYPNPTHSNIIVSLNGEDLSPGTSFVLMNMSGVRLMQIPVTGNKTIIETRNITPGIYLYQVQSIDGKNAVGKLLIQ